MFRREYAPFVVAATVLMTLQPLLTTATKVNGRYQYLQACSSTRRAPRRGAALRSSEELCALRPAGRPRSTPRPTTFR
eukprot:6396814-Prymnesium_polylepis.1